MAKAKTEKTTTETLTKAPLFLYEEVLKESLKYFEGDELAATTWMNKYAMKNKDGAYVETSPDAMHKRMAKQFARMEEKHGSSANLGAKTALLSDYGQQRHPMTEDEIYNLFRDFKYVIPQGSVMAALGNPYMLASLSNCVVIPEIHDSYGSIMYTDQQLVQLFKRRCAHTHTQTGDCSCCPCTGSGTSEVRSCGKICLRNFRILSSNERSLY